MATLSITIIEYGNSPCTDLVAPAAVAADGVPAPSILAHVGEREALVHVGQVDEAAALRAQLRKGRGPGTRALLASVGKKWRGVW
jgi:hypothetical protein